MTVEEAEFREGQPVQPGCETGIVVSRGGVYLDLVVDATERRSEYLTISGPDSVSQDC